MQLLLLLPQIHIIVLKCPDAGIQNRRIAGGGPPGRELVCSIPLGVSRWGACKNACTHWNFIRQLLTVYLMKQADSLTVQATTHDFKSRFIVRTSYLKRASAVSVWMEVTEKARACRNWHPPHHKVTHKGVNRLLECCWAVLFKNKVSNPCESVTE
jgi:hypothetical protein